MVRKKQENHQTALVIHY